MACKRLAEAVSNRHRLFLHREMQKVGWPKAGWGPSANALRPPALRFSVCSSGSGFSVGGFYPELATATGSRRIGGEERLVKY